MGPDYIKPCKKIFTAFEDLKPPVTLTDVRAFFGITEHVAYNFYCSDIMTPFRELLKPGNADQGKITGDKCKTRENSQQAPRAPKKCNKNAGQAPIYAKIRGHRRQKIENGHQKSTSMGPKNRGWHKYPPAATGRRGLFIWITGDARVEGLIDFPAPRSVPLLARK